MDVTESYSVFHRITQRERDRIADRIGNILPFCNGTYYVDYLAHNDELRYLSLPRKRQGDKQRIIDEFYATDPPPQRPRQSSFSGTCLLMRKPVYVFRTQHVNSVNAGLDSELQIISCLLIPVVVVDDYTTLERSTDLAIHEAPPTKLHDQVTAVKGALRANGVLLVSFGPRDNKRSQEQLLRYENHLLQCVTEVNLPNNEEFQGLLQRITELTTEEQQQLVQIGDPLKMDIALHNLRLDVINSLATAIHNEMVGFCYVVAGAKETLEPNLKLNKEDFDRRFDPVIWERVRALEHFTYKDAIRSFQCCSRDGEVQVHDAVEALFDDISPLPELLKCFRRFEGVLSLQPSYREHYVHMLQVFFTGAILLDRNWFYVEAEAALQNTLTLLSGGNDELANVLRTLREEENVRILDDLWILVALSHDVAYPIEKLDRVISQFFSEFMNLEDHALAEKPKLHWTILEERFADHIDSIVAFVRLKGRKNISPGRRGLALGATSDFDRIFRYCLREKLDHGALAALLLYEAMDMDKDWPWERLRNLSAARDAMNRRSMNEEVKQCFFEFTKLVAAEAIPMHNFIAWLHRTDSWYMENVVAKAHPKSKIDKRIHDIWESCGKLNSETSVLGYLLSICDLLQDAGRPKTTDPEETEEWQLLQIRKLWDEDNVWYVELGPPINAELEYEKLTEGEKKIVKENWKDTPLKKKFSTLADNKILDFVRFMEGREGRSFFRVTIPLVPSCPEYNL